MRPGLRPAHMLTVRSSRNSGQRGRSTPHFPQRWEDGLFGCGEWPGLDRPHLLKVSLGLWGSSHGWEQRGGGQCSPTTPPGLPEGFRRVRPNPLSCRRLAAQFQTPHHHLGLELRSHPGLVILISPDIISASLEACQETKNGQNTNLGGTYIVTHTLQHFTSKAGASKEGVDFSGEKVAGKPGA